jgi:hypothetical protein
MVPTPHLVALVVSVPLLSIRDIDFPAIDNRADSGITWDIETV